MTKILSKVEMERTRVARYKDLVPFKVAYVDAVLPEYQRENLKVIGRGVSERADQKAPIEGDHEYSMTIVRIPPGGGVAPHAHPTSEVFMPLEGACSVLWGESEQNCEEIVLNQWDVCSVPVGVMRWFRNDGDKPVVLLANTGGAQSTVTWHEDLVKRVAEMGVVRVGDQLMTTDKFKGAGGLNQGDVPILKK